MMETNSSMREALLDVEPASETIPESLRNVASSGFIRKDQCFFIAELLGNSGSANREIFPDKSELESFVNSINIDDYVQHDLLEIALRFIDSVFKSWRELSGKFDMVSLLSISESTVKVKFHILRDGERILANDLESYKNESVMIRYSCDEDLKFAKS